MKRKLYFFAVLLFLAAPSFAQTFQVKGTVKNKKGETLPGVSIVVKGTTQGTTTNINGKYTLDVTKGVVLKFSYIGFETTEITVGTNHIINVVLQSSRVALNEVVVTGTRFAARTAMESPVPVDVINVKSITSIAPQVNLNQLLNYSAPSFTSNTQTITDGTDEVDPASLRGLGPDQVLVLINGKRRHHSALININGSFGRGNVGTDLNAIPASAISDLQILRDGASAQYGSDAIAGVINIILSKSVNKLRVNVTSGAYFSKNSNSLTGGVDGPMTNVSANYGISLGKNGGYINLTGEFDYRDYYNRMGTFTGKIFDGYNAVEWNAFNDGADISNLSFDQIVKYGNMSSALDQATKNALNAATSMSDLQTALKGDITDAELAERNQTRQDYLMRVGQSALRGGKFFFNMSVPLDKHGTEFYAFGGSSFRNGDAAGFFRLPYQSRTYTPIYINGFLPHILAAIKDNSVAFGIRGKIRGWSVDFSNTWGKNSMDYTVGNTLNASMLNTSPTTFNAGGFNFGQNTINLDISKSFGNVLNGISVAYGAEYRQERYQIIAGNTDSYATYDTLGQVITSAIQVAPTDFFGNSRPGGAQVFPGFRPTNELVKYRDNIAAYADAEFNFTKSFLVDGAIRYENYSDFGSTLNWKLSTLLKASKNINFRASVNTGFRAPSLQQIYFNTTSTVFVDRVPYEVGTFSNDSKVAKALGIPTLKQETSQSFSVGLTAKIPKAFINISLDGYMIWIQNRIVLTGLFKATTPELKELFRQAGATKAKFFANAIDTKSQGIDIVIDNYLTFGRNKSLKNTMAGTLSKTIQVGEIHASKILEDAGQVSTYFDEAARIYLEKAVPRVKFNLTNILMLNKFNFLLRNVYFGKVTNPSSVPANQQVYSGKVITDISFGYILSKGLTLTVGANNLFDIYPDKNIAAIQSSGRFIYPRGAIQFGFGGRFLFARLLFKL